MSDIFIGAHEVYESNRLHHLLNEAQQVVQLVMLSGATQEVKPTTSFEILGPFLVCHHASRAMTFIPMSNILFINTVPKEGVPK